jgi:four helix bundle protein
LTDPSINSYRDLRVWQDAMTLAEACYGNFVQHLRISQGSLKELETHMLLAERVGILPTPDLQPVLVQCDSLGKMLRALIRSLQDKSAK